MRKVEEIINDYVKTYENDELVVIESEQNGKITMFKNEEKRGLLRKEYIETLPENKRLAIFIHDTTCRIDHNDQCGWYYEFFEGSPVDNWEQDAHAEYLRKADVMLSESDFETIMNNIIKANQEKKDAEKNTASEVFFNTKK